MKLKVMTFNLRCKNGGDGINHFDNREPKVLKAIFDELPDLIGFQEATDYQRDFLRKKLSDNYIVLGCGRGKNYKGESPAVAVKRKKIEVISFDTFWLSFTPNVPGSTFGADQSKCPRSATSLLIKADGSDELLRVCNTHLDHVGERARILGIAAIMQYLSKFPEKFVLTGDLNAEPDSSVIGELNAWIHSGRKVRELTENVGGTFHDYGRLETPVKIDYIFSDADFDPERSATIAYPPVNGVYVSDHHPVVATLKI